MRKIINGKSYDTDKATLVGSWDNGSWDSDFDYVEEKLYRKRTGEYFVYGEGGARTRYAKPDGYNSWRGGALITPVTYEEARSWAEEHLDAAEYESEFGVPEEGDAVISVRVPAATKRVLEAECSRRGVTQAELVRQLVDGLSEA